MAAPGNAWRCSQCGTVNEAGARACSNCGKWPSLFDLQEPVDVEAEPAVDEIFEVEDFDVETLEPETFETRTFEPASQAEGEEEPRSRFPRWVITAAWILGLLAWLIASALGDRG